MRAHLDIEPLDAAADAGRAPGCGKRSGRQRVIVAVDDTDDLTREVSTGEIAELIACEARDLGGVLHLDITRHQLLLSEEVPYTSHNSAMAFDVDIEASRVGELRRRAIGVIAAKRAGTSDPGLCVARVPEGEDDGSVARLAAFGRRAKREFCSVAEAYALARSIPWVDLSEHGGDGSGVVGALAGAGLRLEGSDGRFRGKWDLKKIAGLPDVCAVSQAERELRRRLRGRVSFVDVDGAPLDGAMPLSLEKWGKPVLLNGALTVVCEVSGGVAIACGKVDLGDIGNVAGSWRGACGGFERDNDDEECLDARRSCRNCLHRRWTPEGIRCLLGLEAPLPSEQRIRKG